MQKVATVDSKYRQEYLHPSPLVNPTKTTLTTNDYKDKRIITKILGRYYDLTDFKHPAGPIAIACTDGRDATELFMSHHLFTKKDVKDILSQFEIKNPPEEIPDSGVYDWEHTMNDPFTIELHERARKMLGTDIKGNWKRNLEIGLLFIIALTQVYQFVQGYWHTLLTMPFSWWTFGVNIFHDASHFAWSKNWKINDLGMNVGFMFSIPYVWYHQHIIAHHSFPNVYGYDPDLYHSEDILRVSPDMEFVQAFVYQTISFIWVWLVAVPWGLMFMGMTQSSVREKYNRVVRFSRNKYLNPNEIIPRYLVFFVLFHLVPFYLHGFTFKGCMFSFWPIYVFSVCFMISSQINHLTPDTTDKFDKNFFKHQIITSHNVATGSKLVTLFTGGLNLQIEHHLFPSVNHAHLSKLFPIVQELSKKHNVSYTESPSLWRAVVRYFEHVRNYSYPEPQIKKKTE